MGVLYTGAINFSTGLLHKKILNKPFLHLTLDTINEIITCSISWLLELISCHVALFSLFLWR